MRERILIIDIGGSAGDLPSVTPAAARYVNWMPTLPEVPDTGSVPGVVGLTATPVYDGVLIEWMPIDRAVFEIAVASAETGPWRHVASVRDARWTHTEAEPVETWFRVFATIHGVAGDAAYVMAAPRAIPAAELDEKLNKEILERIKEDARLAEELANDLADEAVKRAREIQGEREARQRDVAAAQERIGAILDDSVITPDEKPQLIIDYQALINEREGIRIEAEASEAHAEWQAYSAALDALTEYLATLTEPTRWDDTSGITYIK